MQKIILIFSLLFFPFYLIGEESAEIEQLTFYDNFAQSSANESSVLLVLDKEMRVSSNAGKFNITLENVPDSIATCIYAAVDIWESVIKNETPIYLTFNYSALESANDVETIVQYYTLDRSLFYPSSLFFNSISTRQNTNLTPDAYIYINNNVQWDCSHNDVVLPNTKNMTYAMLRAIATALGFGSSVTKRMVNDSEIITFGLSRGHSVFDNSILSSSGSKLSDISNRGYRVNSALEAFVQPTSETIYTKTDEMQYKMYAPSTFQVGKSLVYLDNENSLMHHNLTAGDKFLQIDDTTIDLLRNIGWTFRSGKDVEIIGVGIDEFGIASAYESHQFQIQNNTAEQISDASWSFSLPLVSGNDSIICQKSSDLTFEIPAIGDDDRYKININGDIYGEISFSGKINGVAVSDTYRISLELKPKIKSVTILRKESNAPYASYNLYYIVEYYGNNQLKVEIEEDYSYEIPTYIIREPFVAHIVTKDISSNYYSWVDITVENEYGSDTYTIELPPYSGSNEIDLSSINNISETINQSDISHIEVYNINGALILDAQNLSDMQLLDKGLYIIKLYSKKETIISKYLKR